MKNIYTYIIIIILTFCTASISGQESNFDIWLNAKTDDFIQIQEQTENYFATRDKGRGTGYKQWKRWEYWNERRLTPDGKITNHTLLNWIAYKEYLDNNPQYKDPDPSDVTNGSWYQLGPTSYVNGNGWNPGIGRVNCIAFHPTDPNTLYIGTPSGGMWKTTDDGNTWINMCNGIPSIGVSGIVVHPSNPNIIYILTGDGDGGDTKSIGVLKSNNGGLSWSKTGFSYDIEDNIRGYKLKMHPTNYNILFAATTDGIYKTIDGWETWTKEADETFFDIDFKPGDPSTMYATRNDEFFKSTDTGETWIQKIFGVPTNSIRMEIGVTPDNSDQIYLLCGPSYSDATFVGVYLSNDSGENFYMQSNSPNIIGPDASGGGDKDQAGYDLAIAISRSDYAYVMVGGINTWVSNDYGSSWTITSYWKHDNNSIGYTHADIHALEINPLNNHLYCGSDGGIYKSTDFGNNWSDLSSGISIMQYYRIAGYEPDLNLIIGGTQDNGTNKWTGGSSCTHILGADGMDCMIDHTNPDIMYLTYQYGTLRKSYDGGASADSIQPYDIWGPWITPLMMDPTNSNIIYAGYGPVYKSTNGGDSWTNMGAEGDEALAIGTNNPDRIYASGGYDIYRSNDGGGIWYDISNGLPSVRVNFIAVNPDYSLDVFVTLEGFEDGEKVYRSTNGGSSWTNITGSLPNIIVNCIAYEDTDGSPDDAIYIGTDIGVFYRDNNLNDWIPFSNWLPTVPVLDLEINEATNQITAGTFGRGLWRSTTYTSCETGWTLGGLAPIGYSYYQASDWINSTRVYNQGVGQEGYFKAGNEIHLLPGFRAINGSKFKAYLGPCGAGIPDNIYNYEVQSEKNIKDEK
ncbi:MAG: hypothetical protein KQI35_05645 [Bacteroidetes bacterium]|nr:hypothetical protein [Bacteroidota bacterium]